MQHGDQVVLLANVRTGLKRLLHVECAQTAQAFVSDE